MATFVSGPFKADALRADYRRADVEVHGVDQAVPSYEARVFLNNPEAEATTEQTEAEGYLGSFFVFGKVECWGEEGHCDDPAERRRFDHRRNPTRFAKFALTVPPGRLQQVLGQSSGDPTLSVVVVMPEVERYRDFEPAEVLKFDRLSIVIFA